MSEAPDRTRHVWVRPAYDVGTPKAGLVVSWRLVHSQTTAPVWQALVMVVDDKTESARMDWYGAHQLVPVRSEPPASS